MANQQEIFTQILEVKGQAEAKQLREEIEIMEKDLAKLNASMHGVPFDQFASAAAGSAAKLSDLKTQLGEVEKGLQKTGGSSRNAGRAVLEGSRALEDLQYGVAGVLNNLPGLIASLGGSPGLAGIVSVAAVSAKVLSDHWGELMSALGASDGIKTAAERMAELEAITKKTVEQQTELLKLQNRAANDTAQSGKPKAQKAQEDAINDALKEGPLKDIEKGLDKHFGGRINAMAALDPRTEGANQRLAKAQADVENANKLGNQFGAEGSRALAAKQLAAAQADKDAIYGDARKAFRDDLPNKPDVTKQVMAAAKADPNSFGPNGKAFAGALGKALDPEAEKRAKKNEEVNAIIDEINDDIHQQEIKDLKARQKKNAESDAIVAQINADIHAQELKDADKKRDEQKRVQANNVKQVGADLKTYAPGLGDGLEQKLAFRQIAGQDAKGAVADVTGDLAKWLQLNKGMKALDAMDMARDQVAAAQQGVNDGVGKAFEGGEEQQQEHRNSEIVGVKEFASKIQSSIGADDTQKKQLTAQEGIFKLLAQVAQQRGGRPGAVFN